MHARRFTQGLLTMAACGAAHAGQPAGLAVGHGDWEIVCDNTRTCRAVGYQRENGDGGDGGDGDDAALPVSLLLTRKAGPREPVLAQLRIGAEDGGAVTAAPSLTLTIDGRTVGAVVIPKDHDTVFLPADQAAALLAALPGGGKIVWSNGAHRWTLSDQGAAAVLLKMDDAQGRVGTPGALVKKGDGSEAGVWPSVPAPVIRRAALPADAGRAVVLPTQELKALRFALFGKRGTCADADGAATDGDGDAAGIALHRLSGSTLLAESMCWTAAYNRGIGYWVVNARAPYAPRQVTDSGSDYADGKITSAQKGRGVGDCRSFDEWVWDGRRFAPSRSGTTGMCRGMAGGAWPLPTYVATVR